MTIILKIAAVSAILAIGVASALEAAPKASLASPSPKLYQDRVAPDAPADRPARAAAIRLADASGAGLGPVLDRGAKGDLAGRVSDGCAAQTWPHVSGDCVRGTDGAPVRKAVRTISLEVREGGNSSVIAKAATPARSR